MSKYDGQICPRPLKVDHYDLPPPPNHYHHYPTIPTPRVGTYNICGYSANSNGKRLAERRSKLVDNMRAAMRHLDVLLVQETKIQTPEIRALFKKDWFLFRNPYYCGFILNPSTEEWEKDYRAVAGGDIYVRASFATNFILKHDMIYTGYLHSDGSIPSDRGSTSKGIDPSS